MQSQAGGEKCGSQKNFFALPWTSWNWEALEFAAALGSRDGRRGRGPLSCSGLALHLILSPASERAGSLGTLVLRSRVLITIYHYCSSSLSVVPEHDFQNLHLYIHDALWYRGVRCLARLSVCSMAFRRKHRSTRLVPPVPLPPASIIYWLLRSLPSISRDRGACQLECSINLA